MAARAAREDRSRMVGKDRPPRTVHDEWSDDGRNRLLLGIADSLFIAEDPRVPASNGSDRLSSSPCRIAILAFPAVQILDVTGPSEVFAIADRLSGAEASADRLSGGAYAVELLAPEAGVLSTSGGLRLHADRGFRDCDSLLDTLIVAGGLGVREAVQDTQLIEWLQTVAGRCRRIASVCTGAFLLAEAGLLHGRRATTHWSACSALAKRHPAVEVEADAIFVGDGRIFTSAGVTAGIDLALALVEDDLGPTRALEVARMLVLFMRRPGGQAQFSNSLGSHAAKTTTLRDLQAWIADHLDGDLTVPALAERAFMSPRNFARVFVSQTGQTPGRYVESLRLERARMLLQSGDQTVEGVAQACGYRTVETLRRSFSRRLGVSPGEYRERFKALR
jgi:transcriptional regulator GlxA family with amidase domain